MACCCSGKICTPCSCTLPPPDQPTSPVWWLINNPPVPIGTCYKTFVFGTVFPGGGNFDFYFGGIRHPNSTAWGEPGNRVPPFTWKPGYPALLSGCNWGYAKWAMVCSCKAGGVVRAKWGIVLVDCEAKAFVDITLQAAIPQDYSLWEGVSISEGGCEGGFPMMEPYYTPPLICPP